MNEPVHITRPSTTFLPWRILKRLLVLGLGFAVTYFIIYRLFPALDSRLSIVSSVFWTYLISAYFLIPAAIRVFRILYKPWRIPRVTTTPDGFASDPVNIALVGTKKQIITSMEKAGWYQADAKTIKSIFKLLTSFIRRDPYTRAPFSSLYLFGRKQDLGFQKHIAGSYFDRHHVRFWACTNKVSSEYAEHVRFWQKTIKLTSNQKLLWVGAAIKDEGLGIIRYHGQLTHAVDEDTDAERELIIEDLLQAKQLKEIRNVDAGSPTIKNNRVIGNQMVSDGDLKLGILN